MTTLITIQSYTKTSLKIVAQQTEATAAIQPAPNCLFIDFLMKRLSRIRGFAGQLWQHSTALERWLQGHHRFKVDMQAAQKTLMGVKS